MDDVSYTLRKEKRKPVPQRIATMIETGMQDGFIDLLREYRYAFQKRVEEMLERISREFESFTSEQEREMPDAKGFFEQHFAGLNLSQSNVLLTEQVNQAIAKHSKKQLEQLDMVVEQCFGQAMERLSSTFDARATVVQQTLLDDFYTRVSIPLERVNTEIQSREAVLLEAKRRAEDSSYDTQKRSAVLAEKLQVLRDVQSLMLEGGSL
jgi:hypothetical protein